ncbi:MAG: hypothetical protein KY461_02445 [Actinobacteria bacterium]|nr:hypothetical protein [Actinomycetota bacterium]
MCASCALELGLDLWCDGHAPTGRSALAAVAQLPPEWDVVARLWWVATGEVRLDTLVVPASTPLPADIRAALGR